MATIKDYQGKSFDVDTLTSLSKQLSSVVNLKGMSGGVYGTKKSNVGFSYKDLSGALGAEPTVYDQVLMDAARGLLKKGITDISKLKTTGGKVYYDGKLLGRGTSIQLGETFTGEGKTTYNLNLKGDKPSFSTAGAGTGFFDSSLGKLTTFAVGVFGGPLASAALAGAKTLDAGGDLGDALEASSKAGLITYGAQQLLPSTTDVGGVNGPDNIDVGGGYNPAAGATTAELATARGLLSAADQGADILGERAVSGGGNAVDLGTATGADLSTAYDLGPTTQTVPNGVLDLGGGITINPDGSVSGGTFTGSGDSFINAASGAAAAGAGAAGSGLLTGNAITDAALIKGATGLAGGLLQGETSKDALTSDATARAKLANEVKAMGKFTPVGITTSFGTSNFVTDPVTGAITPSYTLSPTAKAYQDSLGALGTTALGSASDIMNLGKQYIGESPEAVRQRYIDTQTALLQPGQEAKLAGIRTNLANTGRGGLSFGATSDGMAATNPELAAYYNSLAMTNRGIAADAEKAYKDQVNFGTGLMGSATTPFTNVFNAQKSVETAAQQPLTLSTDFANMVSTRGAAQGANYANAMSPSLSSTYKANSYDPFATFLQGMSDSDLALWGLSKIKP